jgi:hypothetical protein
MQIRDRHDDLCQVYSCMFFFERPFCLHQVEQVASWIVIHYEKYVLVGLKDHVEVGLVINNYHIRIVEVDKDVLLFKNINFSLMFLKFFFCNGFHREDLARLFSSDR